MRYSKSINPSLIITTMKKLALFVFILFAALEINAQSYEYKIVTSIESVVPMGVGRSRIISAQEEKDYAAYTTSRTEENTKQNKSKRSEAKVDDFDETKILNFYDALISSKINKMIEEGWDLAFVTSGVESDAGKNDGTGIFITRFIFRRLK